VQVVIGRELWRHSYREKTYAMTSPNYVGALMSQEWNSNRWNGYPADGDIRNANHDYVQEENFTHTYLNFGHENYPKDKEGYYWGLLPPLWNRVMAMHNVPKMRIIFLRARNHEKMASFIVGFYSFPTIHNKVKKLEKANPLNPKEGFPKVIKVNIKAKPEDIHIVANYLKIDNEIATKENCRLVPENKLLSNQGFNYLTAENVRNILQSLVKLNANDTKLSEIQDRLLKEL
jgi:hypothetical protein